MSVKSGSVLLMLLTGMAVWSPETISADIETTLEGLEYRLIGPWRGGRVTTVTGVTGKPNLYYMGATGGGVWKTTNAGVTWENISDGGVPVGTIGAVAVAESDNNIIYVGTGESPIRGVTTSQGEGFGSLPMQDKPGRLLGSRTLVRSPESRFAQQTLMSFTWPHKDRSGRQMSGVAFSAQLMEVTPGNTY